MNRVFDVELELRDFFESGTIAAMARLVRREEDAGFISPDEEARLAAEVGD